LIYRIELGNSGYAVSRSQEGLYSSMAETTTRVKPSSGSWNRSSLCRGVFVRSPAIRVWNTTRATSSGRGWSSRNQSETSGPRCHRRSVGIHCRRLISPCLWSGQNDSPGRRHHAKATEERSFSERFGPAHFSTLKPYFS